MKFVVDDSSYLSACFFCRIKDACVCFMDDVVIKNMKGQPKRTIK